MSVVIARIDGETPRPIIESKNTACRVRYTKENIPCYIIPDDQVAARLCARSKKYRLLWSKSIDIQLQDAAGHIDWVEVKSWDFKEVNTTEGKRIVWFEGGRVIDDPVEEDITGVKRTNKKIYDDEAKSIISKLELEVVELRDQIKELLGGTEKKVSKKDKPE
jgi:hypothetical protein